MIVGIYILGFLYCSYMAFQIFRFRSFSKKTSFHETYELPFSIILPFRNEATNLPQLLASLEQVEYSNYEFIFVNDYSTDESEEIVERANTKFKLIQNEKEPGKKAALEIGIEAAQYNHIITWDTDITIHPQILKEFNHAFQLKNDMVLGPVSFSAKNNFAANYGMLENTSLVAFGLMDARAGQPSMSNGANLGFRKDLFLKSGGYAANKTQAGGDDEFLMHSFAKSKAKIGALCSSQAMVYTQAMSHWKGFIHQRIRWGKKIKKYPLRIKAAYILSQGLYIAFLGLSILALVQKQYLSLAVVFGSKLLFDFLWFTTIQPFFQIRIDYAFAIASSIFQVLITPLVFVQVLMGKAEWKGRKI